MSDLYILAEDGATPVPCADIDEWARRFDRSTRLVACDEFGDIRVSTVFLGLDHSWKENAPPVLWETMIVAPYGHALFDWQCRYTSRADAEAGHAKAVALVKEAQP